MAFSLALVQNKKRLNVATISFFFSIFFFLFYIQTPSTATVTNTPLSATTSTSSTTTTPSIIHIDEASPRRLGGANGLAQGKPLPSAVALFLAQVVLIILLSRFLAFILAPFRQPGVVAEMLAGIVLGPTVMGRIPGFSATMFPPASVTILNVASNFGLCFFMFLVGMELDVEKLRKDWKMTSTVSATGLLVPAIASFLLALYFHRPEYCNTDINVGILGMFLTCAMGISALPVLARILAEKKMTNSRLGGLSLAIASLDDVVAWVLLAITIALVNAGGSQLSIVWIILLVIAEMLIVFFPVRFVIDYVVTRHSKGHGHGQLDQGVFLVLAVILIFTCWLTESIGLSGLIGAMQIGLIVPRASNLAHAITERVEMLIVTVFLPLYFCNSGLRTQFGLINDGEAVGVCILLIVIATVTKLIGVTLPLIFRYGFPARISSVIGILMACKGLIALIVVNFGLDHEIITERFFAILVLMVLITTMQTTVIVECIEPASRARQSAMEMLKFEEGLQEKETAELNAAAATITTSSSLSDDNNSSSSENDETKMKTQQLALSSVLVHLPPPSHAKGSTTPEMINTEDINSESISIVRRSDSLSTKSRTSSGLPRRIESVVDVAATIDDGSSSGLNLSPSPFTHSLQSTKSMATMMSALQHKTISAVLDVDALVHAEAHISDRGDTTLSGRLLQGLGRGSSRDKGGDGMSRRTSSTVESELNANDFESDSFHSDVISRSSSVESWSTSRGSIPLFSGVNPATSSSSLIALSTVVEAESAADETVSAYSNPALANAAKNVAAAVAAEEDLTRSEDVKTEIERPSSTDAEILSSNSATNGVSDWAAVAPSRPMSISLSSRLSSNSLAQSESAISRSGSMALVRHLSSSSPSLNSSNFSALLPVTNLNLNQVRAPPSPLLEAPLELLLAVDEDTDAVAGLISLANMFPPLVGGSALIPLPVSSSSSSSSSSFRGEPPLPLQRLASKLSLLVLNENTELPSGYMDVSSRAEDLRDSIIRPLVTQHARHYKEVAGGKGVAVHAMTRTKDAWSEAFDESLSHSTDFLLVPEAFLRRHVSPEQSLMAGAIAAAAAGTMNSLRSFFGRKMLPTGSSSASAHLDGIVSGEESIGSHIAIARQADTAPLIRFLVSEPLPCGTAVLFDYGNFGANSADHAQGDKRGVLCPILEGDRIADPALAFLRRTCHDSYEVHVLHVDSANSEDPTDSDSPVEELSFAVSSSSVAEGTTKSAAGSPSFSHNHQSSFYSVNPRSFPSSSSLYIPTTTLSATPSALTADATLVTGVSETSAQYHQIPSSSEISKPLHASHLRISSSAYSTAVLSPNLHMSLGVDGGVGGGVSVNSDSSRIESIDEQNRKVQALVSRIPRAIIGRKSLVLGMSKCSTLVDAVDNVLSERPGAFSLVALGTLVDMEAAAARGASSSAAVEDVVQMVSAVLVACQARKVSVVVISGQSIKCSAADD
jgi:Kef-type K+ transport system membrane component KefB